MPPQSNHKKEFLVIVLIALVIGVGFSIRPILQNRSHGGTVACTEEAKLCPDGSAVGRTGPNCEFATCPNTTVVPPDDRIIRAGYVAGQVTIGPICPVEQIGHPCVAPPETYTSRAAVVYAADGVTIQERVNLDAEGKYEIALAPGTYYVQIQPAGIGPGEKRKVTVAAFETSTVDFDIDTGIR